MARLSDGQGQLSLGALIQQLEAIDDPSLPVCFDFCDTTPGEFASWRGIYKELALGWWVDRPPGHQTDPTVQSLLDASRAADGATFEGWKGGDFRMNRDTPVWVANEGLNSHTVIVEVRHQGYWVMLVTGYCEI